MKYSRRVALFALIDDERKILLQLRDNKAPTAPGFWAFFGGGIEDRESPEEAVRREAGEELDIKLEGLKFFRRYVFRHKEGLSEKFVFTAHLMFPVDELRKRLKEGDDLGLFSSKSISKLKITDYDKKILKDIFATFYEIKK